MSPSASLLCTAVVNSSSTTAGDSDCAVVECADFWLVAASTTWAEAVASSEGPSDTLVSVTRELVFSASDLSNAGLLDFADALVEIEVVLADWEGE